MTDLLKIWPVLAAWVAGCMIGHSGLWSWQYVAILTVLGVASWAQAGYVRR